LTADALNIAQADIVIVGEADDSSDRFRLAKDLLATARQVVFLGFGYNKASLERLQLVRNNEFLPPHEQRKLVTGTSHRLPEPTWEFVRQYVMSPGDPRFPGSIYKLLANKLSVGPRLVAVGIRD
jgi:hypothetical protein